MKKTIMLLLVLALLLVPIRVQAAELLGVGVVTTTADPLNVRSGPSTGSSVIGTLQKGSYVMLLAKTGSWYQVQLDKNRTGYASAGYVTPVAGTPGAVTASALNVRSGGGTSFAVKDYLHSGDKVVVLSTSGGWSRVVYHGTKTGFVSAKYLSGLAGNGVALSVPVFRQNDSRWANVTLGSSGKTMAKVGCATTAIAMMESYRTGTTIYPDTMSKRLRYTSTGSVYWPADYTVVTSYNLSKLRSLLDGGKPVLFGARNSYGTQHWVVITGYTGSGTAAAHFTINDPGTASRVNLGQFLAAYPTFYKYFHY